ncbi:MAG: DUF559 domain-containing protein [Caulobacterales bacterium]|nr:DUF559 domain-containing protein [Caulobacterales bacterium]
MIEIDGGVHKRDDVVLEDHYRQTEIEALGWTVLRFSNQIALETPERIVDAIMRGWRQPTLTLPLADASGSLPLPMGEGFYADGSFFRSASMAAMISAVTAP